MLYIPSNSLEQAKAIRTIAEGMPGAGTQLSAYDAWFFALDWNIWLLECDNSVTTYMRARE